MNHRNYQNILSQLDEIERQWGVEILYACESGSRAWGFASRDSDYDVRFIYCHEPSWYLSIEDRRDVIELPLEEDLDINGWELRKALRLLRKSNPALLEWLRSPIVYREEQVFGEDFRHLAERFFSPKRCFHHYLQMAWGNFRGYLQSGEVRAKKYLYVLRPVLACRWIERGLGQVPVRFSELLETVVEEPEVRDQIDWLVAAKQAGGELGLMPRNKVLSDFLENELHRLDSLSRLEEVSGELELLNDFFRRHCLSSTYAAESIMGGAA